MELLFVSFLAGILTVLAPCILPLLPLVLAGSLGVDEPNKSTKAWLKPITITLSLGASIIVFTLLLKATTALLQIPLDVWQYLSGTIIILLGVSICFPTLWDAITLKFGLASKSQRLLASAGDKHGLAKDMLTGFALGPIFNSCSPTYLFIVAAILPASFGTGIYYLISYTFGLCVTLLLIAFAGQSLAEKLGFLASPSSRVRQIIGIVFIIVGTLIFFGLDKKFQTFVLDMGWYSPISSIEERLR